MGQQQLKDIRASLLTIDMPRKGHNLEREAALEIARGSEAEWNLRSIGTYSLRNEIQRLQRIAADSESTERKLTLAKEQVEQRLAGLLSAPADTKASVEPAAFEHTRQTQELDDHLAHLRLMRARSNTIESVQTSKSSIEGNK